MNARSGKLRNKVNLSVLYAKSSVLWENSVPVSPMKEVSWSDANSVKCTKVQFFCKTWMSRYYLDDLISFQWAWCKSWAVWHLKPSIWIMSMRSTLGFLCILKALGSFLHWFNALRTAVKQLCPLKHIHTILFQWHLKGIVNISK